ncbi:MAG: GAF domain-containing protein [Candidatus Kapaibacterium sp.]|jgi:GAF domain-containing protein|nr:GAF domain-containing protein [Candidatus Kapabacteria bacterium]
MMLNSDIKYLFDDIDDFFTNASNFASYIFYNYDNLNWVGFYMRSGEELLLGPFQGKPACIRIPLGRGVCGSSARDKQAIIVKDVHEFDGHIACDSASNSELVIPIIKGGELIGVLDIDSPLKNRFNENDLDEFDNLLKILIEKSNVEKVFKYYNS